MAVLAVASTGAFLPFLDGSMVFLALPAIASDFPEASLGVLYGVYNAYAITFAACMALFSRLADRVGRRRAFIIGTILFTAAAIVCGIAEALPLLLASRAVQGLGAAMMVPASMTMVIEAFPRPSRGTQLAVWGAVPALAIVVGLILGGVLVQFVGWRWVFLVSVPFGIAALLLVRHYTVESRAFDIRRLPDLLSAVLLTTLLALWYAGVLSGHAYGWSAWPTIALFLGAALCAGAFVHRSLRHPRPLFERVLFRSGIFSVSALVSLLGGMGFYCYAFVFVLWLHNVWGYTPLQTGLAMVPAAAIAIAAGPFMAKIGETRGFRPIIVAGFAVWCLSFLWYALAVGTEPAFLREWLPGQIVSGLGVGATLGLTATVALGAVPRNHRSPATTFAIRQVGGVIGASILIAVIGTPSSADLPNALRAGWLWSAGCFAAAGVIAMGLRRSASDEPEPDVSLDPWQVEMPVRTPGADQQPAGRARTVAIVGLDGAAPVDAVGKSLTKHLRNSLHAMTSSGLSADGLEQASRDHDCLVLTAIAAAPGREPTGWLATCVQHAERIVVVAGPETQPTAWRTDTDAIVDLVLVGPTPASDVLGSWLEAVRPERVVLADGDLALAVRPLAAAVAGTALGVVFAGGGARALCHIGFLEAFESAGVPIDRVAGTSMGAIVGGLYASGLPVSEVADVVYADMVRQRPLGDYTIPKFALTKGVRVSTMLSARLGADTRIEQLPRLFRCVSVDLMARTRYVHRSGLLWEAVAASSRLPAILPPMRIDGRLHVDGGLLDNLPVGTLVERPEGPVIAVNVASGNGHRQGPPREPRMPSLGETLMRSMLIGSGGAVERARDAGAYIVSPAVSGVGLVEFHMMDRLVDAGRAAARALLEQTGGQFTVGENRLSEPGA